MCGVVDDRFVVGGVLSVGEIPVWCASSAVRPQQNRRKSSTTTRFLFSYSICAKFVVVGICTDAISRDNFHFLHGFESRMDTFFIQVQICTNIGPVSLSCRALNSFFA